MLRQSGRGLDSLTPRQLCNLVFSTALDGRSQSEREELLHELTSSLDPMEQAEDVWKEFGVE